MGKSFKVSSFDELLKAAKSLQSLSETYTEIYTELMQTAGTMGAAWEGADNVAFVEQIKGFTEDLKMMAAKLKQAGDAIEKENANYVKTQDANIANVKKLAN